MSFQGKKIICSPGTVIHNFSNGLINCKPNGREGEGMAQGFWHLKIKMSNSLPLGQQI